MLAKDRADLIESSIVVLVIGVGLFDVIPRLRDPLVKIVVRRVSRLGPVVLALRVQNTLAQQGLEVEEITIVRFTAEVSKVADRRYVDRIIEPAPAFVVADSLQPLVETLRASSDRRTGPAQRLRPSGARLVPCA